MMVESTKEAPRGQHHLKGPLSDTTKPHKAYHPQRGTPDSTLLPAKGLGQCGKELVKPRKPLGRACDTVLPGRGITSSGGAACAISSNTHSATSPHDAALPVSLCLEQKLLGSLKRGGFAVSVPISLVRVTRYVTQDAARICNTARFEVICRLTSWYSAAGVALLTSWWCPCHSRIPCCVARGAPSEVEST
jgi:hypothetical protein